MKCPNCNDNLVFDSKLQKLVCKSCDSVFEPASFNADQTSSYSQGYTKYTCRSCGAELMATYDTSALGFCPYCGGESILASRLEAARPNRIIPFSRTKKNCRNIYMDIVSSLKFVPDELKDEEHIEAIRGIYIPYNIYKARHKGKVDGEFVRTRGKYEYTCSIHGQVESTVSVPYDGSAILEDYIGEKLFPYSPSKELPFKESYLATYYVELPDADDSQYIDEVKETVIAQEMEALKQKNGKHPCTNKLPQEIDNVTVDPAEKEIVLTPAYFLSYRNKDRVCYTVIPGITDKRKNKAEIYAEIPVDTKKYLAVTLMLSAFIWAVLSFVPFMPTFKHTVTMGIMNLFVAVALTICMLSYTSQELRLGYDTLGDSSHWNVKAVVIWFIFIVVSIFIAAIAGIITPCVLVYGIGVQRVSERLHKRRPQINIKTSRVLLFLLVALSTLSIIAKFVFFTDEVVYTIMTLIIIPIVISLLTLINEYNRSCSRAIQFFNREGGHNEAKDI